MTWFSQRMARLHGITTTIFHWPKNGKVTTRWLALAIISAVVVLAVIRYILVLNMGA